MHLVNVILLGVRFAGQFLVEQPQGIQFLAALAAGILGALVALVAQRLAFALAGFFAGAYLAGLAADALTMTGNAHAVAVLVGAVVGAVVAAMVMDWAIVILSSLMGAGLAAQGLALAPQWTAAAFVALAVIGVIVQGRSLKRRRGEPPPTYAKPAP
jgi:hypothetical protein